MRVVIQRVSGGVVAVSVRDDAGLSIEVVDRFLKHLLDSGCSPNTAAAYGYDLRYLFEFLSEVSAPWHEFRPALAVDFLAWLSARPNSHRGRGSGSRLSPATVSRALAAVSSFYEWAAIMELFDLGHPLQQKFDPALARVGSRHQPFAGGSSRQMPVRRDVRVKVPLRLPRPMEDADIAALVSGISRQRDLAMILLMLDGGLRPGEVLMTALTEIPQFCSLKFPTPGRFRA
ncbi:tyrosine-type recombinase/integrase [Subtercola boreus]|nr:site-specific integrase [Subtercola boreus]